MTSADRTGPTMERWRALGPVYVAAPPAPSHRSFGFTVGGVLAAISLFSLWRGHPLRAEIAAAISVCLLVAAAVSPSSLARLAAGWGRVGHALGWVNSRILLAVLFILVLWPIGLISRLFGSDPLGQRRRGESFWTAYSVRVRDPKHYERLF
jgi:Saxitoxin biosynthesis operon protein SxtJ